MMRPLPAPTAPGHWLAALLCVLGVGPLSGCASLGAPVSVDEAAPQDAAQAAWMLRQQALAEVTGFRLSGRAALQSGATGWSARLEWVQQAADWSMELVGPLNQGTVRMSGDARQVVVESEGERVAAPNLEALIGDSLGWRVPIEALRWWVLGLPAPDWPAEGLRLDEAGRLTDVRQGPWRLSVLSYVDDSPLALPRKIYVNGEAAELRLVVARWSDPP
jgi:outer membrane lipoprotein LolB